jgi:hypothetical protein
MRQPISNSNRQSSTARKPIRKNLGAPRKSSRVSTTIDGKSPLATDDKRDSKSRSKGKYSEKYKYIRFVERKKVVRKMRQIQQQLIEMTGSAEKDALELKLAELRLDLIYIEKYPGNEKYISLFPSEGSLSEACIKKQKEIRDMITKKTANAEIRENQRAKMDVIKNDDFFASPEDITSLKPKQPVATDHSKPVPNHKKSKKAEAVHPSWDAKKNNQKLTGSIADQKFEGSRLVFNDSDNE